MIKKEKTKGIFKDFVNIIILIATILYGYFAYKNPSIPLKFHLMALAGVLLLVSAGLIVRNRLFKILVVFVVLLGTITHVYIQSLINTMFIGENSSKQVYKQTNISVLVLNKNSDIELNKLVTKKLGESKELDEETKKVVYSTVQGLGEGLLKMQTFKDHQELVLKLYNDSVDAIIFDETKREEIEKIYPSFSTDTKILYTFEKKANHRVENPLTDSFIVYLSGNDTEGSIKNLSRSDVNLLLVVNPRIHHILMVSIPRDSYVPLSCGNNQPDKFTHAGIYGMECQIGTIKNILPFEINYYVRVNFSSVINVVNILGGKLRIWNPYAFNGGKHDFGFGCLPLDGEKTLEYIRARYNLPDGDIGRQEHQKIVLNALIRKISKVENLFNMGTIFNQLSKEMDTNIDTNLVNQLISEQINSNPDWKFDSIILDGDYGYGATYSMGKMKLAVFNISKKSLELTKSRIKEFMKADKFEDIEFLQPKVEEVKAPTKPQVPTETKPLTKEEIFQQKEKERRKKIEIETKPDCIINP